MSTRPDAAGMRHAAAQLRSRADRTGALSRRLEAHVGGMVFAGPAADDFRAVAQGEVRRLAEVARILDQLAGIMLTGAASVEADPVNFYGPGGAR